MKLSAVRFLEISFLAWLAFVGLDFLLHGALLEEWYREGHPALLPLEEAFERIPVGYAGFFLLVALVVWLAAGLKVRGAAAGLGFGAIFGLLLATSHGLALASITTLDPGLILWWSVGEAAQITVVGCIAGFALSTGRLGRLAAIVLVAVLVAFVLTITIQNL